jgi:hypothetical protein
MVTVRTPFAILALAGLHFIAGAVWFTTLFDRLLRAFDVWHSPPELYIAVGWTSQVLFFPFEQLLKISNGTLPQMLLLGFTSCLWGASLYGMIHFIQKHRRERTLRGTSTI